MSAHPYRYLTASTSALNLAAGSASAQFYTYTQLGRRFRGRVVQAFVSFGGAMGNGVDWADARWQLDRSAPDNPDTPPLRIHHGALAIPLELEVNGQLLESLRFRLQPIGANWDLGLYADGSGGSANCRLCGTCTLLILPTATY